MARPDNLDTKIFLDGGDPKETKDIINTIGFLDGQTTNPSLIAKNPKARERIEREEKFTREELLNFYKGVIRTVSESVPDGSVSIEVYSDSKTSAKEMFEQGKEMFSWIPNAHIKYPTTAAGLEAAERSIRNKMRVNMTLIFTQAQAAAVYAATRGAKKGQVFVSPFVGRLDDRGENGMDVVKNIVRMYKDGDGHVEVLTASVRSINHFLYALNLGSDIITAPYKIIKEWGDNMEIPGRDYVYETGDLKAIPYQGLDLMKPRREFDIKHELTDIGLEKFAADWNNLIAGN